MIQVVLCGVGFRASGGEMCRVRMQAARHGGDGDGAPRTYVRPVVVKRRGDDAFGNDAGGDRHRMDAECVLQVASTAGRNGEFKLYIYFLDRETIDSR